MDHGHDFTGRAFALAPTGDIGKKVASFHPFKGENLLSIEYRLSLESYYYNKEPPMTGMGGCVR
jgi:hypothetical protein